MKLGKIASVLGARLENGDADLEITGVAGVEAATAGQLTFIANPKYVARAKTTQASAVIVGEDFRVPVDQGLQLFTTLRRNGVPSEGLVFQDEGHWVLSQLDSKRWHETVFSWMRKYLAPLSP